MLKVVNILILLSLTGCLKLIKPGKGTNDTSLKRQVGSYVAQVPLDKDGFILSDKCDSLLFSGLLAAAAPELNVDLTAARDATGSWHRRPNQDCGPRYNNSRSSISRDMMVGVMWYAWRTKDLQLAEDLFASLNGYTLPGSGDFITRTLTPAMYKTLQLLIEKLGGAKAKFVIGGDALGKGDGFVAHLNVWHILLRGEIEGGIVEPHYNLLKHHAEREPMNPLYLAAWAKYSGGSYLPAIIRLKQMFGPELPTTDDWCSEWIIERDYDNKDWAPCSPHKQHTGAELITIYRLILE